MTYACELIQRERRPALVVRTRTPVAEMSSVLGPAWGAVMACAAKAGAQPSSPPFVAYHNMDMSDLDIEIGFAVPHPVEGEGDVAAGDIAAGRAAVTLHVGPYDQVGAAYEALQDWMRANDLAPAGPPYEFYLNDPQDTPPDQLQTRVVWAVQ